MEFEFDKEIDAILRKAQAGEVATSAAAAHMDADEISAFAENAVTEAARGRYTSHLADCTRCRKILSNTILLNSEAETETASSAVRPAAAVAEVAPWYRKFFVFPQLAYTMGGLVLLFSGFFGYLMLKNLPTAERTVSYSTENRELSERPAPAAAAANTASNSNSSATTNSSAVSSSAPSNATTTTNSAPLSASNTTTAATPAPTEKSADFELNSPVAVPQPTPTRDVKSQDKPSIDGMEREDLAKVSPAAPTAGAATQNRALKKEEKQKKDTADSTLGDDNKSSTQESQPVPMSKSARKQPSNAGETRSVGGKTFNNVGGIWFDSAYGKQKQKTFRRGTSDYLRLDAGLRSIADNLGGTVVIVWSGKAYKIQ
jgi:hypothetical protein